MSLNRRQQNSEWYDQRNCFFIHDIFVFKERKDPTDLLKRLLQPQDISHIPATKWGIDKEDIAKSAYVAKVFWK